MISHADEPFAVVELFTSEGCSSCPPADTLLTQITAKAEQQNLNVYTLGFHVDYWNQLGWPDPLSQNAFTQRQNHYARILNSQTIYTPQMIVNGVEGFTGSDAQRAWKTIQEKLQHSTAVELVTTVTPSAPNIVDFNYLVKNIPPNSILNTAILERNWENDVTKGENAGRVLKHTHSVLLFKTEPLVKNEGRVILALADEWKNRDLLGIAYIQNEQTMRILDAEQFNLNQTLPH